MARNTPEQRKAHEASKVTIKKNEDNPEPMEIIADAIIEVARGFQKIKTGKLTERAVIVLIKDITGQPVREIEKVLNAAQLLERQFIKQK